MYPNSSDPAQVPCTCECKPCPCECEDSVARWMSIIAIILPAIGWYVSARCKARQDSQAKSRKENVDDNLTFFYQKLLETPLKGLNREHELAPDLKKKANMIMNHISPVGYCSYLCCGKCDTLKDIMYKILPKSCFPFFSCLCVGCDSSIVNEVSKLRDWLQDNKREEPFSTRPLLQLLNKNEKIDEQKLINPYLYKREFQRIVTIIEEHLNNTEQLLQEKDSKEEQNIQEAIGFFKELDKNIAENHFEVVKVERNQITRALGTITYFMSLAKNSDNKDYKRALKSLVDECTVLGANASAIATEFKSKDYQHTEECIIKIRPKVTIVRHTSQEDITPSTSIDHKTDTVRLLSGQVNSIIQQRPHTTVIPNIS